MIYKEEPIFSNGIWTRAIKEKPPCDVALTDKKSKARLKIQKKIFDPLDSISDNSKMIQLLAKMNTVLWSLVTDEQRNNLPEDTVEILDYFSEMDANSELLADKHADVIGMKALIDKLYMRQKEIAKIVSVE